MPTDRGASYRKGLIDDQCRHTQQYTRQAILELEGFRETVEGFIAQAEREEVEELARLVLRLPKTLRGDFWQWNYPAYREEMFAGNLRSSVLIVAFSTVEFNLRLLCRETAIIARTPLWCDDIHGSVIERARKFLGRVVGFDQPPQEVWQTLARIYDVRNVFVHHGGDMRKIRRKRRLRSFVAATEGIDAPHGYLRIGSAFCREALEKIAGFFEALHSQQQDLCRRHASLER